MPNLSTFRESLLSQPGYTLMRGIARFSTVRAVVVGARKLVQRGRLSSYQAERESRLLATTFPGVNRARFIEALVGDGAAFGLVLPAQVVKEIFDWAASATCFADREPNLGFDLPDRHKAEAALGKRILLAQYFNVTTECPVIRRLAADPLLESIAGHYLGSVPRLVGANLWWTFPVKASVEDRERHAHLFHRDVDDFRFMKYFFYLTDVNESDGAHVCVLGSHEKPPKVSIGNQWKLRRYSDEEIWAAYEATNIKEICGPAGMGFAENTLCIHKARTPTSRPRLMLQLQYALYDYGVAHDRRDPESLTRII